MCSCNSGFQLGSDGHTCNGTIIYAVHMHVSSSAHSELIIVA